MTWLYFVFVQSVFVFVGRSTLTIEHRTISGLIERMTVNGVGGGAGRGRAGSSSGANRKKKSGNRKKK
jgi:hypothetical protein